MTRKFKFTQRSSPARHVPTIGEQYGTARTVGTLKASCEPVVAATRLEQSSRFLTRFLPTHSRSVQRDAVRLMLDMLVQMTADDIAELDRIRRHLRGE